MPFAFRSLTGSRFWLLVLALLASCAADVLVWGIGLFLSHSHLELLGKLMHVYRGAFMLHQLPYFFSEHRFLAARWLLPGLLLAHLALCFWAYRNRSQVTAFLHCFHAGAVASARSFQAQWQMNLYQRLAFGAVCLLLLGSRAYLFTRYPISGDELITYFAFVKPGFWLALSYYPEPNNHVFYSLTCLPFTWFFTDPALIVRVPALLANLFSLVLVFAFLRRHFGFATALTGLLLTGLAYSTTIYAVHGRGYMLLAFFTLLAFFAFGKLCLNPGAVFYRVVFIVASVLGAFTLPLFIQPFAGFVLFGVGISLRQKSPVLLKQVLSDTALVGVGVLLLYLPVLVVSGPEALLNNKYLQPHPNTLNYLAVTVPWALAEGLNYLAGTLSKGYVLVGGFALFLGWAERSETNLLRKRLFQAMVSVAVCTILLHLLRRTYPETRMLTFFAYLFYVVLAMATGKYLEYWKRVQQVLVLTIISLVYVGLMVFTFDRRMESFWGSRHLNQERRLKTDIRQILQTKPAAVFVAEKAYYLNFLYQNELNPARSVQLYTPLSTSIPAVDWIILDAEKQFPPHLDRNNYQRQRSYRNRLLYKRK